MLHAVPFKHAAIPVLAVLLGVAAALTAPKNQHENSAVIFQSNPFRGALSVQQRDGVTIIKHHDRNGNSVTIIQQK